MKLIERKRIKLVVYSLTALTFASAITSCVKDNFELDKLQSTEWNPNLAVPLVYSSLSIADMLAKQESQGLVTVDADNFCTLVYRSNLFSLVAEELIEIPNNQPPPYIATLNAGEISAFGLAGTVTVPYSQTITFDSGNNGPKIDSVIFKTGSIDVSLSSDFQYSGQIKIILPGAKKNGVVFSKIIPFTYSGSVPVTAISSYDLAGYKFDMTNGGTAFNEFVANFEVTLSGSGNPISPSNQMALNINLSNMKFDKIFGDIGQMFISPDIDTIDISVFRNVLGSATFSMVDPRIKVIIGNSYGVPIQASLSQFEGFTPGTAPYAITGAPNPLPIQSPTFSQVGQILVDSFSLNNTTSNIATVINNTPRYLIYKINSLTNPAGGTTHNNFVIDTSRLKLDMEIQLPLYGKASNLVLMDTIPFELSETLPDAVEWALIRTYNSNGFPFDVDMQVYFADSLYTKLDSLVVPNQLILQSGTVDSNTGMVTTPTSKTYDAALTKVRLDNLKTSKYLLVKAVANTTNGGNTNVKIYSHYKVDFRLGLQVQVKAKI
ncbi:MAG: hypothetical protein WAQ28_20710 [Bacteroidia bacterium]